MVVSRVRVVSQAEGGRFVVKRREYCKHKKQRYRVDSPGEVLLDGEAVGVSGAGAGRGWGRGGAALGAGLRGALTAQQRGAWPGEGLVELLKISSYSLS